jgi:hypothetical protein
VGGQEKALEVHFEGGAEVLLSPQRAGGVHEPGVQVEDRAPGPELLAGGEFRLNLGPNGNPADPGRHLGVIGDDDPRGLDEVGSVQSERFGVFERQDGVCCARVDDAVEVDRGTALGLKTQVQNGRVAIQVSEALAGHETVKSAGGDVGRWDAEEPDPRVQEPELVEELSFGIAYGDDLAPANSDALATMVVDLRREGDGMIFAVLGVNLWHGAGGHGEEIDHAPIVPTPSVPERASPADPEQRAQAVSQRLGFSVKTV